jgi:nitroreductase
MMDGGNKMNVITTIERRREITRFKEFSIPSGLLEKLTQALYLSPSGNNLPSREFVLITNRQKLLQLSATTPYMKWLDHAAAGVVIIGNQAVSKYWLQDAAIAGGYLWLAATSLELGAAWGAVYHAEDTEESMRRENYVRELLLIPDNLRVVAIIGLGYPDIVPQAKQMYPLEAVFHREAYKNKGANK